MPAASDLPIGRPDFMTDIEWLVALEEIRQLKARRDRYVDAHDWEGYAALHAPDHVSAHAADPDMGAAPEPWTTREEMIANIVKHMGHMWSTHHSYDADIRFESATRAHAIWATADAAVYPQEGFDQAPGWAMVYGYYYESYEKRGREWLFVYRRWERYLGVEDRAGTGAIAAFAPRERLRGADAFDRFPRK